VSQGVPLDNAAVDLLLSLYADGLSATQVAAETGVSVGTVVRYVRAAGLSRSRADGISAAKRRAKTPIFKTRQGYVLEYVYADDPYFEMGARNTRSRGRYAPQHRLVMARSLGRALRPDETVHHINGVRDDNRLENLQLRQGRHGSGVKYQCLDCGGHNVHPVSLD
jgi:hypothetical protein